jgi:hypothetical protein
VRGTMIVSALLTCAWFVVWIQQTDDVQQATSIVSREGVLSIAQARHADSLLRDAGTLNPDTEVDVVRAQVALGRGDGARARDILEGVVRREPLNLAAWAWLVRASRSDARERLLAFSHVLQLDPPILPAR